MDQENKLLFYRLIVKFNKNQYRIYFWDNFDISNLINSFISFQKDGLYHRKQRTNKLLKNQTHIPILADIKEYVIDIDDEFFARTITPYNGENNSSHSTLQQYFSQDIVLIDFEQKKIVITENIKISHVFQNHLKTREWQFIKRTNSITGYLKLFRDFKNSNFSFTKENISYWEQLFQNLLNDTTFRLVDENKIINPNLKRAKLKIKNILENYDTLKEKQNLKNLSKIKIQNKQCKLL